MIFAVGLVLSSLNADGVEDTREYLLRLKFQKDAVHRFVIDSTHTVKGSAPATVSMRVTRRVLEVKGNRARIESRLDDLNFGESDPRNALFAKLVGSAWRGWIDDRGRFEALTLVPPKDLPRLLLPMAEQLKRLLPGRSLPLPQAAQRLGDDWLIAAKDLAASPDGSWAKSADGGLQCKLVAMSSKRATIAIGIEAPLGVQKNLKGSGEMVINLSTGVLESFRLKNRLLIKTKVAGDTSRTEIIQDYRLSSQPGVNP